MQIRRQHFMTGMALAAMRISLYSQPNPIRFAVIGDMGTGQEPQFEVAARMNICRQAFPFDFVLMLGDNIYGGHKSSDYHNKFELPYKALLDGGVQFYGSLGNHDSSTERFYKPFNMNGQQYYTYKKGNVQFFVLDTNYMKPEQLSWLEKELKNSGADWK